MTTMGRVEVAPIDVSLSSPAKTLRKKSWLLGAAFFLTVGVLWYGYEWLSVGRFIESTDDAYVGGNVTSIAPHVAGFVAQILVDDNQYVRAGQPLVRLDDRDFKAAVDHATAILGEKKAALASLEAKELLQQSAIRQAKAEFDAKAADAAFKKKDEIRYQQLMLTTYGSVQNAERATSASQAAESAANASAAAIDSAKQALTVLGAQIAEAQATLAQAEADLRTAELNLSYIEIRSPIDGFVGNRAAEVGAYVASGAYLTTVIPAHGLWVDANFKEDQLARMTTGEPATVVADVLPGHVFHGRIASLAPGAGAIFSVIPPENATGNFTKIVQRLPVRIALDEGDPMLKALRPGLSITAKVDTQARKP